MPAAAAARTAEHLRRRWILPSLLLPEQLNTCVTVDFAAAGVDGSQPLPPTGDSRKKKGGGEICACFRTPIPLLAGVWLHLGNFCGGWLPAAAAEGDSRKKKAVGKFVPASARPSPCFRWICSHLGNFCGGWLPAAAADRRQPQKKRRWGNLCLLSHTHPLACGGVLHPWHFDPLTVISLSPRKSPGAAGALSLSPDGVSDPAEGAIADKAGEADSLPP